MTAEEPIQLLSGEDHPPIVKLPTRHFPSVAIQGDTVSILVSNLKEAESLRSSDVGEAFWIIAEVRKDLEEWLEAYEKALSDHGYIRPY